MIYLDHNATTPPHAEALVAMARVHAAAWANPSSPHRLGQAARRELELGRAALARLIGAAPADLILCASGTEADTLALRGRVRPPAGRTVILTPRTEHAAIREGAAAIPDADVHWLPTDAAGRVDPAAVDAALGAAPAERVALVSVAWANNETGVIQPVEAIGAVCRSHGVAFHVDAVQWVGRAPADVSGQWCDLLTFAAHKFGGGPGTGGLWLRPGVHLEPVTVGGGQESGRRAGTENAPAVAAAAAAADVRRAWIAGPGPAAGAAVRDRLEAAILAARHDAVVHGGEAARLWNTSCIGFPGLDAESALIVLSERGVCAAAGAACSSGSMEPSPVLLAMGVDPMLVAGSIRFSVSPETTEAEVDAAAIIIREVVGVG